MLRLLVPSSPAWLETVLNNFDAFLQDHASCERKASATAMSLVAHYPDRPDLVDAMIALALEELTHFQQVVQLMRGRQLTLAPDQKDPYIGALRAHMRTGREAYFLDRLLVGAVVEARGCERFGLIAGGLSPGPTQAFYRDLTRAEARHGSLFLRLARAHFPDTDVRPRLDAWLTIEAEALPQLPLAPRLH